jgi:hypothetical protein
MAKKKFTSESIPDVFYEVLGEEWLKHDLFRIGTSRLAEVLMNEM